MGSREGREEIPLSPNQSPEEHGGAESCRHGQSGPYDLYHGFLSHKSADKRSRVIDQLLASENFADHWTGRLSVMLLERQQLGKIPDDEWRAYLKRNLREEGPLHRSLDAHTTWISSLAFHPSAPHLFTADYQGVIYCWAYLDEKSTRPVWTIPNADRDNVRALAVTPDGKLRSELGIRGKSDGPFNSLCFLANGILAGHTEILHANSELVFWKIEQSNPLHSLVNPSAYELSLHPDGRQLLAACYVSGGSSGNGARKRDREKYLSNGSTLRVFSLYKQPADT